MKCDDCLNLIEENLDGEATSRAAERLNAHITGCAGCGRVWDALVSEQEVYGRYDRDLKISPSMWDAIANRSFPEAEVIQVSALNRSGKWWSAFFGGRNFGFALAGAMATIVFAFLLGSIYLFSKNGSRPGESVARVTVQVPAPSSVAANEPSPDKAQSSTRPQATTPVRTAKLVRKSGSKSKSFEQSDLLFTDTSEADIEDRDTSSHLERAQNLLRSIRNIQTGDDDEPIDVTYEKAQSRQLLNDNIVLRRDAEMTGKFPVKSLLGSLEPFLIDIANLPDKASPAELRQIKDRVQQTEIVAALESY